MAAKGPIRIDWISTPFEKPIPVDWQERGDDWLAVFGAVSGERFGGHAYVRHEDLELYVDALPMPYLVYQPNVDSIRSVLFIYPLADGRVFVLIGGGGDLVDQQISPWVSMLQEVMARFGEPEERQWRAVIGLDPDSMMVPYSSLAGQAEIGPFGLTPFDHGMEEWRFHPTNLRSWKGTCTWPILVHGESLGHDFWRVRQHAIQQLRVLCSLLSIATELAWTIRLEPQEPAATPIEIPEIWPEIVGFPPPRSDGCVATPNELPDLGHAWDALDGDPVLQSIALMYHEALLIENEHPSLGTLAYVAVVEAIGNRIATHPPEKCTKCENVPGSAARFRGALRTIVSKKEIPNFMKIYEQRSLTVHSAELHGSEKDFGSPSPPSLFRPNTALEFSRAHWTIRAAATKLLRTQLGLPVTASWIGPAKAAAPSAERPQ